MAMEKLVTKNSKLSSKSSHNEQVRKKEFQQHLLIERTLSNPDAILWRIAKVCVS